MSHAVVHLDAATRVTYIKDLVGPSDLFHCLDIGHIVIQAHSCPSEVPVCRLQWGKSLVAPGIFSVSRVSNPDIITLIEHPQMERLSRHEVKPICTILLVTMLEKDRSLRYFTVY